MIEQFIVTASQQPQAAQPCTQVTQYTTYPGGRRTVRCPARNYPVQQNVPVYCYPNYGPVQVQYDSYGRPYYGESTDLYQAVACTVYLTLHGTQFTVFYSISKVSVNRGTPGVPIKPIFFSESAIC